MSISQHKYSAGGVVIHDEKVLIITSPFNNTIGLPKGKIDPDETPEQTAVREVKEEAGYDVEIVEKLKDYTYEFSWTDGEQYIKTVTYYLMKLANNNPPVQNLQEGEDFKVSWVSFEEAMARFTYDETKDALKLAINTTGHPSSGLL